MLTTCPAASLASPLPRHAAADDETHNALPDPARDATPIGRPRCKIAGTIDPAKERKPRSIPAERNDARQNLRPRRLCAGPRAPLRRQLTPLAVHGLAYGPAHGPAADTAATAPVAVPCHRPSRDSAGSLAAAASDAPPADMRRCNNATASAQARTAVHTPSANSDVLVGRLVDNSLLAADRHDKQNDSGPREPLLPLFKSRSEASTSLRGVFNSRPRCSSIYQMCHSRDPYSAPRPGPKRGSVTLSSRY